MTVVSRLLVPVFVLALWPLAAQAHHAFKPAFDVAAPVELSGTVTSVDYLNPHTVIHLAGSDAGKPARDWLIEAATPNTLLRSGINRAVLTLGMTLIVRGFRAKRCPGGGACKVDGRALLFDNGRTVYIGVADCGPRDTTDPAVDHPCWGEGTPKPAR